jgi:hypothetical protein
MLLPHADVSYIAELPLLKAVALTVHITCDPGMGHYIFGRKMPLSWSIS